MKVLIVDDHTLFAEAIQMALSSQGFDHVELVVDADQAIAVMADPERHADVVLMDLGLPGESGISLGGRIAQAWPDTKVLALTASADPQLLQLAMQAGFSGYLTKDTQVTRLVNAMRTVLDGGVVIPQKLARSVSAGASTNGIDDPLSMLLASQLTGRELEVLQLLAEGATSDGIASAMQISRNTVRTHVQSILTKLDVHSRLEAAAFAVSHGLVEAAGARMQPHPSPSGRPTGVSST